MKSLDQELSQGSFLILPVTIIIGLVVYNYKRVRTLISSVYCCTWLSCFITAHKRSFQHASQATWPGGWADPPPPMGYYGIWSTSGRYAFYWNAFLLTLLPPANEVAGRRCFQPYLSVIVFTGGAHVTTTHDAIGESRVTWDRHPGNVQTYPLGPDHTGYTPPPPTPPPASSSGHWDMFKVVHLDLNMQGDTTHPHLPDWKAWKTFL